MALVRVRQAAAGIAAGTVAAALLAPSPLLAVPLHYTDIHPPGWKNSSSLCVNVRGDVVGYGATEQGERGFLWNSGKHVVLLPAGADEARAVWINGRGEIAGTAVTAGVPRAFLLRDGEYVDPTPDWGWSEAVFVGEDGSVLGNGELGSFLWKNGAIRLIPEFSSVTGGDSTGRLIGHAGLVPRLLLPDSGYVDLVLPGLSDAAANGINEAGRVALSAVQSGSERGFVYSGGWFIDMTPPGWTSSRAMAINDLDQVVGYGDAPEGKRGFLRTAGVTEVVSFPGRAATVPVSVNDLGQVAGTATDGSGAGRAFVASPAAAAPGPVGGGGCAVVPGASEVDAGGRAATLAALFAPALLVGVRARRIFGTRMGR